MLQQSTNATLLAGQIEQLADLARSANNRAYWKQYKHVIELFATLRPLERNDRGRLEARFNSIRRAVQPSKRR